jgi:hypothetical protein
MFPADEQVTSVTIDDHGQETNETVVEVGPSSRPSYHKR